tara:strand:+ start:40730 stop:41377 length:648 start_codon:yes stop_codon:yes gene_type:complete
MDIETVAWYIVQLSGAQISVVGSTYFKFMLAQYNVSETAAVTVSRATVVEAKVQRACINGKITYSKLVAPSGVADEWGYVIASITRISPAANRGMHLLSVATPSKRIHPRDSVHFATAYAARVCDAVVGVTCIDERPAYILRVHSDTIWFDMREYAAEITTKSGHTPERLPYANGARLVRGPYKWTHSGHATTIAFCNRLVAWIKMLQECAAKMR